MSCFLSCSDARGDPSPACLSNNISILNQLLLTPQTHPLHIAKSTFELPGRFVTPAAPETMAGQDPQSNPTNTLETLQSQTFHHRRMRPPDIDVTMGNENRVPLRADKLGRRESKLGLRSIFGRHKPASDLDPTIENQEPQPKSGGIRLSLAEISNWPYGFHSARSESLLPRVQDISRPLSTAIKSPTTRAPTPIDQAKHKKNTSTASKRGSLATWDPPPLFQAYPQAIKHAHLPACTQSAESLVRIHGKKESISVRDGLTQTALSSDQSEDSGEKTEKAKKRHRRNTSASSIKLDWTTKIYVLVTSGYVLQYAGEGSFDRLPEKMLHLGKDSAAFASDLIPGRHWVLQVSSAFDSEAALSQDSRSLFGRFPFRGPEKRHASNFLMVFENAEEMDSWIATLRREIEALGGKKNLSETGKPKADDNILQLRAQPSQRTLVVRDPERFSRVFSGQDMPWDQEASPDSGPDIHLDAAESDTVREHSFDDLSTTNSVVSHDARQLEGLRDSANRLSFISSGQRTILTSDSSPSCSPIRDSFASQLDDVPPLEPSQQEVRLRPNAAAILDRRQSMQTMNNLLDFRHGAPGFVRSQSTCLTSAQDHTVSQETLPKATPNFSLPHSANKRQSLVSPTTETIRVVSPANTRIPPARGVRRPPPPSLGFSRPLSIVADQPSPSAGSQSPTKDPFKQLQDDAISIPSEAPDTPSMFSGWTQHGIDNASTPDIEEPPRASNRIAKKAPVQVTVHTSPRKFTSMISLRPSEPVVETRFDIQNFALPQIPGVASPIMPEGPDGMVRSKSSMGIYPHRSRSPPPSASHAMYKRSSMFADSSNTRTHHHHAVSVDNFVTRIEKENFGVEHQSQRARSPAPRTSMSNNHLRVDSGSKDLLNRRSMPHLAGPPLAPPPTCALPPIPQKLSAPPPHSKSIRA